MREYTGFKDVDGRQILQGDVTQAGVIINKYNGIWFAGILPIESIINIIKIIGYVENGELIKYELKLDSK